MLLTRPAAASAELADCLTRQGIEVVTSPLLRIRHADSLPDLADGLIFTSPNGVAAYRGLAGPAGLPVWCVGPRTSAAATAAGLRLRGTAPDAAALVQAIPSDAPALVHLRGAVQRIDLAAGLRTRGLRATDAVIYHQDALPLSQAALSLLRRGPVLVPLYSPRTAALFAAQCPPDDWSRVRPIALSRAVADMLPIRACVAEQPDGQAMLREIGNALGVSAVEGQAGSH
ncbi:uroporphyrinogen-III synthase [Jannaschia sp. 2305UL9-9]|uniref:uroporphyrinogen-III synthase n=1 Tax=Jannaschia sp. 2305UL9-9 TaxID=3121638 RepID=UPI003526E213